MNINIYYAGKPESNINFFIFNSRVFIISLLKLNVHYVIAGYNLQHNPYGQRNTFFDSRTNLFSWNHKIFVPFQCKMLLVFGQLGYIRFCQIGFKTAKCLLRQTFIVNLTHQEEKFKNGK